jgi:hypothetical protein
MPTKNTEIATGNQKRRARNKGAAGEED